MLRTRAARTLHKYINVEGYSHESVILYKSSYLDAVVANSMRVYCFLLFFDDAGEVIVWNDSFMSVITIFYSTFINLLLQRIINCIYFKLSIIISSTTCLQSFTFIQFTLLNTTHNHYVLFIYKLLFSIAQYSELLTSYGSHSLRFRMVDAFSSHKPTNNADI